MQAINPKNKLEALLTQVGSSGKIKLDPDTGDIAKCLIANMEQTRHQIFRLIMSNRLQSGKGL